MALVAQLQTATPPEGVRGRLDLRLHTRRPRGIVLIAARIVGGLFVKSEA